jgi:hypothetical protein
MKRALLFAGIALLAGLLHASAYTATIAATVNGHVITTAELDYQMDSWQALLGANMPMASFEAAKKEHRREILHALIDRELILQTFYREGNHVPESEINRRVTQIINEQYGGDREAFMSTLQERGITLEKYREEIADNCIVDYMRSRYGDKNWPKSLRAGADITIY